MGMAATRKPFDKVCKPFDTVRGLFGRTDRREEVKAVRLGSDNGVVSCSGAAVTNCAARTSRGRSSARRCVWTCTGALHHESRPLLHPARVPGLVTPAALPPAR